jgi:ABC-type polysaccharide/polyol phosphate transport system ATPase subunit
MIEVSEVSKFYKRRATRELAAKRLHDAIRRRSADSEFWALRNISLRIGAGEKVGIVGGNGAGKSTLLSIIAGVTAPSSGRVHTSGRLSALLELGAGFHPDLSGRENAITYAALVGLHRREALERLDSIVEFSELDGFIDQPLRTYSSGMASRLAFSVAAHVDPDVLILDEVLSVGDAGFQEKCRLRIEAMAERGITLILVSHSLSSVAALCDRVVWLKNGELIDDGPSAAVVSRYEEAIAAGHLTSFN